MSVPPRMWRSRPELADVRGEGLDSQCVRLWGSYLLEKLLTLPRGAGGSRAQDMMGAHSRAPAVFRALGSELHVTFTS